MHRRRAKGRCHTNGSCSRFIGSCRKFEHRTRTGALNVNILIFSWHVPSSCWPHFMLMHLYFTLHTPAIPHARPLTRSKSQCHRKLSFFGPTRHMAPRLMPAFSLHPHLFSFHASGQRWHTKLPSAFLIRWSSHCQFFSLFSSSLSLISFSSRPSHHQIPPCTFLKTHR